MPSESKDWYLRAWLGHFKKRQADLVRELGWNKSKAHFVWHSRYEYRRDLVNEVSAWLQIEPFELLMDPQEALALRQLRETAAAIVSAGAVASETRRKAGSAA